MDIPLANYDTEKAQFQRLLQRECRQRILLFQGQSGSGKTTLIQHCLALATAEVHVVSVQLRGSDTTLGGIFQRLGRRARWERLPTFTRRVAALQGTPEAYADLNWQAGMGDHINAVLQVESLSERRQRQAALTDAWFADLQTFASPFLLALDTYEQASSEIGQWLDNYFLPWVAEASQGRILLAGQSVPRPSAEWGHCAVQYELRGVREAEAWLPVAEAMGRQVPDMTWLAGACAALDGHPGKILSFIQTLPKTTAAPALRQGPTVEGKQLRRLLVAHFDDTDLQEVCFDLEVNYDELDGDNIRSRTISLIRYMENRGRYPELVKTCRELRPRLDWGHE